MIGTVVCPTCGNITVSIDWAENCECNQCGSEWNEWKRKGQERQKLRDQYQKKNGVRPIFEPKIKLK